MLIVIGIILALGGIVLVNLLGSQEKSERDTVLIQIKSFDNALSQFRLDMKRYPTSEEGLAVLWNKDALQNEQDQAKWRKYMDQPVPRDTWGSEWVYHQPSEVSEELPYDIVSLGPDKEEGTQDDISNHQGRTGEEGDGEFEEFSPPPGE
jgi:general secretion pathway protein G